MSVIQSLLLLLLAICVSLPVIAKSKPPAGSTHMRLVNHAGKPVELFWIDNFNKADLTFEERLTRQTTKPLRNASEITINSFDTHEFLVRFMKHEEGKEVTFKKGPREETITVDFNEETGIMAVTQVTKFDELMTTMRNASHHCDQYANEAGAYTSCLAKTVEEDVLRLSESKERMSEYRDMMSIRLRNYTCRDESLETTEPLTTHVIEIDEVEYEAEVMLDLNNAKIWVVKNFLSPEECNILTTHAEGKLTRATVAAEDGTSVVSEHRRANQASYDIHEAPEDDPLWPLYDRVFTMTNEVAGFNLVPDGQEDFTIIQYNVSDEYTPHCDGSCDNSEYIPGGRVASAVLYCGTAVRGGGTTFTKADVFVKPEVGMATFFTYKDPKGTRMDEGYTEHSGCPVIEGEKWIATVWMREGVSYDDPWTNFDPSGVRMLSDADQQELDRVAAEAKAEKEAQEASEYAADGEDESGETMESESDEL